MRSPTLIWIIFQFLYTISAPLYHSTGMVDNKLIDVSHSECLKVIAPICGTPDRGLIVSLLEVMILEVV